MIFSERIESRTSTNIINNKKEPSKDENKTKDNELKAKRSNPSINGSKDNGETSSKVNEFFFRTVNSVFLFLIYRLYELQMDLIHLFDH